MKTIKSIKKNRLARIAVLWLVPFLILTSFLFVEFMNHYNYLEVFPNELIFPFGMHAVTALIIALIVYFVPYPKRFVGKFVTVTILGFAMIGFQSRLDNIAGIYRVILPVLPSSEKDMPILAAFFLLTIFIVAFFAGVTVVKLQKRSQQLNSNNIILSLSVIIGFIFFSQLLRVVNVLPAIIKESKTQPKTFSNQNITGISETPDIYYIVLDRYTNEQVLKDQFGYDNSKFTNFLKDEGIVVNKGAFSNYPLTTASISSTINAQYTNGLIKPYVKNSVQSRTLYHNLIRQSVVVKALKENGYKYYHIGSSYGASDYAPLADESFTNNQEVSLFNKFKTKLTVFGSNQFKQSPYYSFSTIDLDNWPLKSNQTMKEYYAYEQLEKLNYYANQQPGKRFIFAHILAPHDPYYYNDDGSVATNQGTDNYGKQIKDKYTGQVKFISDQIEQTVKTINSKSKERAVIIINADEGAYPWDMAKTGPGNYEAVDLAALDFSNLSDDWTKMKYGILQAVQIPKASDDDLNNLNSANIFRIILNNYLGYNLEYLPYCAFAFNDGDKYEYRYTQITSKLTGKSEEDSVCKNYQSQ